MEWVSASRRAEPLARTFALYIGAVATLRLFASAREAAGVGADTFDGTTVGEVLAHVMEQQIREGLDDLISIRRKVSIGCRAHRRAVARDTAGGLKEGHALDGEWVFVVLAGRDGQTAQVRGHRIEHCGIDFFRAVPDHC